MHFDSSTDVPSSFGYDCAVLSKLPYGGTEILLASSVFLFLCCLWSLVYADIVFKQWFPSTFLDPTVNTMLAQVKEQLPNLKLSDEEKSKLYTSDDKEHAGHYAMASDGTPVQYNAVAAQESYIASKTIDLDMFLILLNNSSFSTMSEYSADSVRGYNMLSSTLTSAAFCLTFLSLHNFYVDPRAIAPGLFGIQWGVLSACFYPGLLCTAIVMTGPSRIVNRNSNICLFSNLPNNLGGKSNPLGRLHVLGVVLFAVPTIIHTCQLIAWGSATMPNFSSELTLLLLALGGALGFGLGSIWHKFPNANTVTGNNISITGEWFMMIACILSCAHWESFPTMYCSGNATNFQNVLYVAFLAPFALVARTQIWSPTQFATVPSLLLLYNGVPTATWGPCPVEAYHGEEVPNTQMPRQGWCLKRVGPTSSLPHIEV